MFPSKAVNGLDQNLTYKLHLVSETEVLVKSFNTVLSYAGMSVGEQGTVLHDLRRRTLAREISEMKGKVERDAVLAWAQDASEEKNKLFKEGRWYFMFIHVVCL